MLQNNSSSRRERSCCPGRHSLGPTFFASVVAVDSPQSYDRLPRGRWPSEGMPCKLDGILHFKSNSFPEAVYLPGFLPVPGTSVNSARQCYKYPGYGHSIFIPARNFCKFCTPVPQYPKLLEVLKDFHTRTRNFCIFCNTFMPVIGIYLSYERPVSQYPGYGYSMFCTRPEVL